MNIIIIDTETTGVTQDADILEIGLVQYNTIEHNSIDKIIKAPKLSILIHRSELNHCQLGALKLNSDLINEISNYANEIAPGADEYRVIKPYFIDNSPEKAVVITNPEYVMNVIYNWLLEYSIVELTNYGIKKFENQRKILDALLNGSLDYKDLKYYLKPVTLAGKNIATFDIPILKNNIPGFNEFKYRYRMIDPTILYTSAHDQMLPQLQECLNRLQIDTILPTTTKHRAVDDCNDIAYLLYFHFKQTKFRTYVAIKATDDMKIDIVDEITLNLEDSELDNKLAEFKDKNKEYLISYDLSFHRVGSLSRLSSFHTELTEYAIPTEIQALKRFEGKELVINKDTIIEDYKLSKHPMYNTLKFIVNNIDSFSKNFIKYINVEYLSDQIIIKPDENSITIIGKNVDLTELLTNVENAFKIIDEKTKQKDEKTK